MAGEGFTFDWQSVERISRVVSEFESQPIDGKLPTIDGKPAGTYHAWCKVLSSAGTAGVYNAVRAQVDSGATPWSYDAQVLVKEVNGKTLTVGSFYYCHLLWFTTNSKPVYGVESEAATATPVSVQVVTNVTCSGSSLVVTKKTLTIPGGTVT
jgi:hypothetical protein